VRLFYSLVFLFHSTLALIALRLSCRLTKEIWNGTAELPITAFSRQSPTKYDVDAGVINRVLFGRRTRALRNSPEWLTGIARKKLIQYPDFQITLRRMKPNTRIPEHFNPGRICVQTLFGHIRMHADGRTFDLPRGRCLALDRAVIHDVEAVEESGFLLTVARNEAGTQ
jgi:quercetin dioxygenase-like cupin family protein